MGASLHFVREEVSVKLDGGRLEACLYHHFLAHIVQRETAFLTLQQIEWAPGWEIGIFNSACKQNNVQLLKFRRLT